MFFIKDIKLTKADFSSNPDIYKGNSCSIFKDDNVVSYLQKIANTYPEYLQYQTGLGGLGFRVLG